MSRSVRKHAYYLSPAIPPARPHVSLSLSLSTLTPHARKLFTRGERGARSNIGHSRVSVSPLPPLSLFPSTLDSHPRAPENKHRIEPFLQIQIAGRGGRERLPPRCLPPFSPFFCPPTFSKKIRPKKDKEKAGEGNSHGSAIRCQNTKFDREE